MPKRKTVPFNETDIKNYLDSCIRFWRGKRSEGDALAPYYIDAFQSVRITIFSETLPGETPDPAGVEGFV